MKTLLRLLLVFCLVLPAELQAQRSKSARDRNQPDNRSTTEGIIDRAGGKHNKSNIGAFFENRGKLYARTLSQGASGEFPQGSLHEYIYRVNPYVGFPGNVIQGRFTTDEEWEAVPGYNKRDSAKIAFSDKPNSWPPSGWPVKDAAGNDIFVSNQDSYCVYSDSNNSKGRRGIQINQTGYAFNQKGVRDLIYFIFEVTNRSANTYDSLYFGFYMDCDIGGYDQEYGDDRYVFDKKWGRVYGYDVNGWSSEWNGPTAVFGLMMMRTPKVNGKELGITDLHWCTYDDDNINDNNIEFGRMASTQSLYESANGPKYFHLGANAPDLHFDDFSTQPAAGLDPVAILSSGPYRIAPGDTLKFVTAMVAGNTIEELDATTAHAYSLLANNFQLPQPPQSPNVTVTPGDRRVTITWDNRSESCRDPLTGKANFEGYSLYKSVDKGQFWDQIDRNLAPNTGPDPVPLAKFDRVDGYGKDVGLQYSYIDTNVTNGFEYWYTLTATSVFDSGATLLESARGGTTEESNLGTSVPRSAAVGRVPVTASAPQQVGNGTSHVLFDIQAVDLPDAGGRTYRIDFAPVVSIEQGNLQPLITVGVVAAGPKSAETFGLIFLSPTTFMLRNLTERTVLQAADTYQSGVPILFEGLSLTLTDTSSAAVKLPKQGDSLVVRQGVRGTAGTSAVLPLQAFSYGTTYATTTGLSFALRPADTLAQSRITYLDSYGFSTSVAGVTQTISAGDLNGIKVVPNPYVVASQYEPEFGSLRREPIRQLKFNNLPSRCTIYIFNVVGDRIQTIEHNSDNGTESWNLRAAGNREIAPGIYVYLVKTDTAEKIGRFAVIK
jgi:hypothetical protein